MPQILSVIFVCVLWCLSSDPACAAEINPPLGVEANAAFEATPFLTESIHTNYKTLPPDWQTASGALRLNLEWEADHSKPWFIEYQLQGGRFVVAGKLAEAEGLVVPV